MHAVRATRATESELFTPTIVEVRSSAADGDASTSSFAAVDEIRFGVSAKRRKKDVDHRWMCAVALQSMHDGMPAMLSASHSLYASDDVSRSVVRCSATPLQHAEQAFRIVLLRHADGSAAEPTTRDAACFVDLVARSSSRPGGGEASARRAGVAWPVATQCWLRSIVRWTSFGPLAKASELLSGTLWPERGSSGGERRPWHPRPSSSTYFLPSI